MAAAQDHQPGKDLDIHKPTGGEGLEERLARAETNQSALAKQISDLSDSVRELGDSVQSGFDTMQQRIQEQQKTPWGAMATWAMAVLTVVLLVGRTYVRDQEKTVQRVDELEQFQIEQYKNRVEDARRSGIQQQKFAMILHRIEVMGDEREDLRSSLRRGMKLRDQALRTKLNELDEQIDALEHRPGIETAE